MKYLKYLVFLSFFFFTPLVFCQSESFEKPEIPTEFEADGVVVEIPEALPEPIEVPELPTDKTEDLFKSFGISRKPREDEAFLGLLGSLKEELQPLYFSDIPLISEIPMPAKVKEFFSNIVMFVPSIKIDGKGGFSVTGDVKVYDVEVWARIAVSKNKAGKTDYSIVVRLPKKWKFSDTFPKTKNFDPKKFDLLEFSEAWFAFSSARYLDPVLEREVREGLNLFGTVKTVGPLFKKLDLLFGGKLSEAGELSVHGAIGLNEQLLGSLLIIDLPTKVKFTEWLQTSPLAMIFAIEDRISQVATPIIAFRGALDITFPFQEDPVSLSLTGKYIFPEDIEFYAQMDGWIRNVPLPGIHFGNQRFGIIVDLVTAAITQGGLLVSGINAGGAAGIMDSYYSLQVKGALSPDTVIGDLTFIFDGTARLSDLVGFWIKNAEGFARIFKKDVRFYKKAMKRIPDLELEDVRFAFVPRETIEEKKRIEVQVGKLNLFGLWGSGRLFFSSNMISGGLHLPEITLGPKRKPWLKITGSGIAEHKGVVVDFEISPYRQSFFADTAIETSLFGGIRRAGRFDLYPGGFEFSTAFKWADLVDTDLQIKASMLKDGLSAKNMVALVNFEQEGLDQLSDVLMDAAKELLEEVQDEITRIRDEVIRNLERRVGSKQEKISQKIRRKLLKISRKERQCRVRHPQKYAALLRRACEILKGVPLDVWEIVALAAHKDVTLELQLIGGKLIAKTAATAAKGITLPLGKFSEFLAKLIANTLQIKTFKAEASLENLKKGEPLQITAFDATLLGKDFSLEDIKFSIEKRKEFIAELFKKVAGVQDDEIETLELDDQDDEGEMDEEEGEGELEEQEEEAQVA